MSSRLKLILILTSCCLPWFLSSCHSSGRLGKHSAAENIIPPLIIPPQNTPHESKESVMVDTPAKSKQEHSKVVDKICAIVDSEQPILLSEVNRKAKESKMNEEQALKELLHERALRIYGRQLKFSTTDTHKAAEDHIAKVMKENNLTAQQFDTILHGAPYFTTLKQYSYDTAFLILQSQIEASIASSIQITEKDLELAMKQQKEAQHKEFEVLFISILPTVSDSNKSLKGPTTSQFNKANNIRMDFLAKSSLESIKMKYKDQKDVKFNGPIDYEEGVLKSQYEAQLKKNPSIITEPFADGGAVTMILRIEKVLSPDMSKTALENVRNDLYKKAVRQRLDAVTKELLVNVPVVVNCTW